MDGKMIMVGEEQIDTTGWFDNPSFESMVTEQLRYVFTEEPPILYFQFQYEHADDPVMINIDLPLASSDIQMVSFSCSLEEAVDDVIFYFQHRDTDKVSSDEGREVCGGIATRLRELANKLENAMG